MKEFVCIVCPNGCRLKVSEDPMTVEGARCPKGRAYAEQEVTNPKRTVTSTVRTVFDEAFVLPVKTNGEIPKGKIFDVMAEINSFVLKKRVERGEVIIENVADTGIDIIATSNLLKK